MIGTDIAQKFICPKCHRVAVVKGILITKEYKLYLTGQCRRCLQDLWMTWDFETLTRISALIAGDEPLSSEMDKEDEKFLKAFHISLPEEVV